MEIQKLHFVYFTPIMLTRKVVYNIAHSARKGTSADQVNLTAAKERLRAHTYGPNDLLIAACPTFGGRVPVMDPPLFRNLQGQNTPAVVVTTYGGRGYDDTLVEMQSILGEQGFVVIGGGAFVARHAMSGAVCPGRPNSDDLALARELGEKIRDKADAMDVPEPFGGLPGNTPFKPLPPPMDFSPITSDECVLCMQCFRWCPTDAIPYNDPNHTHHDKCILCHGCIVRCPVHARKVVEEPFLQKVAGMEQNLSGANPVSEIFV